MVVRLVLNDWKNWLIPGSRNDSRLFHADRNDRVFVCPPHFGQGYIQEIPLRDDLSLFIHDYTLDRDLVIDTFGESNCVEFEFTLAGTKSGYSFFQPHFGLKKLIVKPSKKRFFKIEVIIKQETLLNYFQIFMECVSPETQSVADRVLRSLYQPQKRGSSLTPTAMLNRIFQKGITADSHLTLEEILFPTLYSDTIIFNYANRHPITPSMEEIIGQILSCPDQGATRRKYLEHRALELVFLHLQGIGQPQINQFDRDSICQAASILRNQLTHPPTVEVLAREVCSNRLKLNQGFRQVYGTTPFNYLRDCRLMTARRLLMMSDLSVSEVAAIVGYTCRSKFAIAFRKEIGINPKAYQIQAWETASRKNAFRHQNL
jgi:AraC-like DNA-binding protein